MGETKGSKSAESGGGLSRHTGWILLGLGLLMTAVGGTVKTRAVIRTPELFEYVFFSGPAYVLMATGLLVLILAIGHSLLFGAQD